MNMIVPFILGMAITAVAAIIVLRANNKRLLSAHQKEMDSASELIRSQMEARYVNELSRAEGERDMTNNQLRELKKMHTESLERANNELQSRLEQQHQADKEMYDHSLEEKDRMYRNALQRMEEHHAESIKAQQARFDETIRSLSSEMKASTEEILKKRQEDLDKTNTTNMNQLLTPLQKEMEEVRKLMGDTKSANEKSSESLKGALEAMISQTQQLGKDATNLADALRNKGKVHGDWGEHVLEDILLGSGLREGIEYHTQVSYKGEHGNELRPDVVVRCADGKNIIVDAKVSLKDYTDALGAETEEERKMAIRKNFESIKKHVTELADKQYPKYVDNSLAYVLMFVPNEGSYVMAMNHDPSLLQEAFRRGVIIVNPTNLMLTLYLVVQTWQNTRQEDNCKRIIEAANGMYDKVVILVDSCTLLGNQLHTALGTYGKMSAQLSEGTGNLMNRVSTLKELGVTSTKMPKAKRSRQDTPMLENGNNMQES